MEPVGHIDARDAAQAIRKALAHKATGAEVFIIANADSVMSRPNDELLAAVFPDVPRNARSRRTRPCWRSTRRAACSATSRNSAGASNRAERRNARYTGRRGDSPCLMRFRVSSENP
jgi:hypothetical protein